MFIQNKYSKWYSSIINHAKLNPPISGERHHIIPSSMGGGNEDTNLVLLTERAHFICHKLLLKMTSGGAYQKMLHAFCFMALTKDNKCLNRKSIRSRDYNLARRLCKERIYTTERNKKISDARKGKSQVRSKATKEKHRDTLAKKKLDGIKMSQHQRDAIARGLQGNKNSEGCVITSEHRAKISAVNSKRYLITSPDASQFEITGLQKWLRTMNCNTCILNRPYKRGVLKGYTIKVLL